MNDIKPIIFLVPVIVLILIIVLYFYVVKTTDRKVFNEFFITVIIFAFFLNLAWELIQIPLYKNSAYNTNHIAFCALASLADVLMVLLLYLGLALIFKNPFWIKHLKPYQFALVVIIGGVGAVLSEMRHLSLGSWAYDNSMPLIPVVNVGISPLLQFMILPILIYFLSFKCLKKVYDKVK